MHRRFGASAAGLVTQTLCRTHVLPGGHGPFGADVPVSVLPFGDAIDTAQMQDVMGAR